MSHMAPQAVRFSMLEEQGVFRMESFGDWHGEDWGQYQDDIDAAIYYSTLGLVDPTLPGEVGAYRKGGSSWPRALGMTFARLAGMFVLGMWLIDPADKREGGLAETEWYRENIEPWYSVPGDIHDWMPFHSD